MGESVPAHSQLRCFSTRALAASYSRQQMVMPVVGAKVLSSHTHTPGAGTDNAAALSVSVMSCKCVVIGPLKR
jgi:hypothetical protein